MRIRHDGFCRALDHEIEVEVEYIETSDLESETHTYKKGLVSCYERMNHSKNECVDCIVAEKAPETYSIF